MDHKSLNKWNDLLGLFKVMWFIFAMGNPLEMENRLRESIVYITSIVSVQVSHLVYIN